MKNSRLPVEIRITFLYLLFGGLWILFSDMVLEYLVNDVRELTRLQSFKGWFYVAASGTLIFFLIRGYTRQERLIRTKLSESEERLILALSISEMGIFDVDLVTGKVRLNQNSASTKGNLLIQEDEAIEVMQNRIHPDDRAHVDKAMRDCLEGKTSRFIDEFRHKVPGGEWHWSLLIGSVVERNTRKQPVRILGIHMDITRKKSDELIRERLLEDSQRRLERISSLHEIDREISSKSDISTTLSLIVKNVKNHLNVDAVSILLFDESTLMFKFADGTGFSTDRIKNASVKLGGSYAGIAAKDRKRLHIHDFDKNEVDEAFGSLLKQEGIVNYLGIPLLAKDNLVGVLELFVRKDIYPDSEWMEFFDTLAGQAALAIENARLIEGLGNANNNLSKVNQDLLQANSNLTIAYDATIESLAQALNLRDFETEGHSRRVTTMMNDLAGMMDFTAEELINIHRGTLLHDIGKIGVPDTILLKPGKLTEEERLIMQQHPVYAYNLLKAIEYLQPALDIPHLHHEKWDGTGYPYGLAGHNIPLPARLFAIVDVYDALTSDRPYRKAWSREKPSNILKNKVVSILTHKLLICL